MVLYHGSLEELNSRHDWEQDSECYRPADKLEVRIEGSNIADLKKKLRNLGFDGIVNRRTTYIPASNSEGYRYCIEGTPIIIDDDGCDF